MGAPEPLRFRDRGETPWVWMDQILVSCPRCRQRALVSRLDDNERARLVCDACSLVKHAKTALDWQPPAPVDPWFGYKLWLQAPFGNYVVWAFNRAHATCLRDFVAAELRERAPFPPDRWSADRMETMSMIEKLIAAAG